MAFVIITFVDLFSAWPNRRQYYYYAWAQSAICTSYDVHDVCVLLSLFRLSKT